MSPASQGNLEVERFIGPNLISSWARVNNSRSGKGRKPDGKLGKGGGGGAGGGGGGVVVQRVSGSGGIADQYGGRHVVRAGYPSVVAPCECAGTYGLPPPRAHSNWTAGMPLISGKKKSPQYQRSVLIEDESSLRTPLSRLAIHTQGAPLILAGRCNSSRTKNQVRGAQPRGTRSGGGGAGGGGGSVGGGGGGGGDVNARRSNKYKDNHPHGLNGTSDCLSVASDESSGSSQSENCLPRIIKPRKRRKKDRKPVQGAEGAVADAKPAESDAKSKQEQQISTGSHCDDVSEDDVNCPKLHHSFEDVAEGEPCVYTTTSCQCHYCDPSGIWDASFFPRKAASFLTPPPDSTAKSFHYYTHSDLVLRRSWSEPLQSQAQAPLPAAAAAADAANATVPPQRSNSFSLLESWKSKNSEDAHRWKSSGSEDKARYRNNCLEVSTEIVTSPNGHRDIEIRFYTTSPPA